MGVPALESLTGLTSGQFTENRGAVGAKLPEARLHTQRDRLLRLATAERGHNEENHRKNSRRNGQHHCDCRWSVNVCPADGTAH